MVISHWAGVKVYFSRSVAAIAFPIGAGTHPPLLHNPPSTRVVEQGSKSGQLVNKQIITNIFIVQCLSLVAPLHQQGCKLRMRSRELGMFLHRALRRGSSRSLCHEMATCAYPNPARLARTNPQPPAPPVLQLILIVSQVLPLWSGRGRAPRWAEGRDQPPTHPSRYATGWLRVVSH